MLAMQENTAKYPGMVLEIQRVLQDGNLVAVHSRIRLKPGDLGVAVDIAQLWDIGQAALENSPNEYGMF